MIIGNASDTAYISPKVVKMFLVKSSKDMKKMQGKRKWSRMDVPLISIQEIKSRDSLISGPTVEGGKPLVNSAEHGTVLQTDKAT